MCVLDPSFYLLFYSRSSSPLLLPPFIHRQLSKLKALQQSAAANGVPDLQLLSGQEACSLEPSLSAAAALLSPSTGEYLCVAREFLQYILMMTAVERSKPV